MAIWLMHGVTFAGSFSLGSAVTSWSVAGVRDFNGDGVADILWREVGGALALWVMSATIDAASIARTHLVGIFPTAWTVAGVHDFDADQHADILWRHDDGTVAVWLMNGPHTVTSGALSAVPVNWIPR